LKIFSQNGPQVFSFRKKKLDKNSQNSFHTNTTSQSLVESVSSFSSIFIKETSLQISWRNLSHLLSYANLSLILVSNYFFSIIIIKVINQRWLNRFKDRTFLRRKISSLKFVTNTYILIWSLTILIWSLTIEETNFISKFCRYLNFF
jgi:hypothetical protein